MSIYVLYTDIDSSMSYVESEEIALEYVSDPGSPYKGYYDEIELAKKPVHYFSILGTRKGTLVEGNVGLIEVPAGGIDCYVHIDGFNVDVFGLTANEANLVANAINYFYVDYEKHFRCGPSQLTAIHALLHALAGDYVTQIIGERDW